MKKPLSPLVRHIVERYNFHNDEGISTERLLAMVADDCGVDVGKVMDALFEAGVFKETK